MTLLLTLLALPSLGVTGIDCCECKTGSIIDKMGEESWDCRAPGGGLGNQAPGLATFQVLHDKTNSINLKPELQFGHRLMIKQFVSWNYKWESQRAIFGDSPMETLSWLGLQMYCDMGLNQHSLSLDVGQNPIWWWILCSFLRCTSPPLSCFF